MGFDKSAKKFLCARHWMNARFSQITCFKTFSAEAYRNEIGRYEKQEPSKKSGKTSLATYFDGVLDHLIKLVEEEPILWDKCHPKWLENNKKNKAWNQQHLIPNTKKDYWITIH